MSIWRPNYTFNTSTVTLENGTTSVEIGSSGGTGNISLPRIGNREVGVGYTITISDPNDYISGLTISPNPSDSGVFINGETSITTYIKGTTLKVSYEGFNNWILIANDPTGSIKTLGVVIDGAGSVISTGIKSDLLVPYNLRILSWQILADQTGNIQLDIWKDTYSNFPPTVLDSIVASAPPFITSGSKNQSGTLTGWSVNISKDDILRFYVTSASAIKKITLTIKAQLT
jgi:hypothetical protein